MANLRKKCVEILLVILLALSVVLTLVMYDNSALAQTQEYFSDDMYTNSDKLLNIDGTPNESRTIKDFAKEAKIASFVDLGGVIPLQYLESQEENAVFAYNGKEYGFYVVKEGEFFDVLLIDFVYEFKDGDKHSDLEYKIQIKPLVQQRFERIDNMNGGYIWKVVMSQHIYYVSNPRFETNLLNENALNYGDAGYSKYADDGLIINQMRINYGSFNYVTNEDEITKENVDIMWAVGYEVSDILVSGSGTIVSLLEDLCERSSLLAGTEAIVRLGDETSISTNMSKTQQLANENIDSFSRYAGFAPKEGSSINLSNDDDSFAEFIVVLNDTNYSSRLIQNCEFDIVRREYDSRIMEYVTGAEDDSTFSFGIERFLFKDQPPEFEIDGENFESTSVPVYALPRGEQTVSFTPQYSGVYSFDIPSAARLSMNGVEGNSFALQAGNTYNFKIKGPNDSIVSGVLRCEVERYYENKQFSVSAGTDGIVCYVPTEDCYKKAEVSNVNARIGLLDEHMNTLINADSGSFYYNFIQGQKYYFVIHNNTNEALQTSVAITSVNKMLVGTSYDMSLQDKVLSFTNEYSTTVYYKLKLTNDANTTVRITDFWGNVISAVSEPIDGGTEYKFSLAGQKTYYINFVGNLNGVTATVTVSPTQCKWRIWNGNMQDVATSTKKLKPNAEYFIEMDMYVDGVKIDTFRTFITYFFGLDCKHTAGKLSIGNVANNEKILLVPREAPDFGLSIVVDDMITTIKLMCCDGTQNFSEVKVELGHTIQGVGMPIRKGHSFAGYFTSENGEGTQYINENLQGVTWDKDIDNYVLYAHWEKNVYKVTLHNDVGGSDKVYRISVFYGEMMPVEKLLMGVDGKEFVGFFSERNGQGREYYKMELVNNPQEAVLNGGDVYLQERAVPCSVWDKDSDGDLYAFYISLQGVYSMEDIVYGGGTLGYTEVKLIQGETTSITPTQYDGYDFKYFAMGINKKDIDELPFEYKADLERSTSDGKVYPKPRFIAVYEESKCIAAGSLITLADGRQVPVETLTGNEMLLVWNLQTGTFDSAKILFIDKDPSRLYKVINLGFSDGTNVKVISEHAFWDFDLNKYVYLDSDAAKYIGHYFNKQITNADGSIGYGRVQLVSVDIRDEYTTAYSPVTYGHLCYYVNGMLSVPGGIAGLFNIFDVDAETMTVNAELMEQDVLRYGLFTYEEFAALAPISEEVFNAFNGQYLKVAIGKGLITADDLQILVARYAGFLEEI